MLGFGHRSLLGPCRGAGKSPRLLMFTWTLYSFASRTSLQIFSVAWSTATNTGTFGSIIAQSEFERFYSKSFELYNYDNSMITHALVEYARSPKC